MNKKLILIGVTISSIAIIICSYVVIKDKEKQDIVNPEFNESEKEIADIFDGYNWSWPCWSYEVNFTLWKENIINIEKQGGYWLIKGNSSERDDPYKRISSDESGRILIVYDQENDRVTDWCHGEQIPSNPEINESGVLINEIGIEYC